MVRDARNQCGGVVGRGTKMDVTVKGTKAVGRRVTSLRSIATSRVDDLW